MKERPLQVDVIVGYESELHGAYDNDWYWVESDVHARTVMNRYIGESWWTSLLNDVAYQRTSGDSSAFAHIYIAYIVSPTGTDVFHYEFPIWDHWVATHTMAGIPPLNNIHRRR